MNTNSIECEHCGASAGEPCKIGRNLKAEFHTPRVKLAETYSSIQEWWNSLEPGIYPSVHARIAYESHAQTYIGQKLFHRIMRDLYDREWYKGLWVYRK